MSIYHSAYSLSALRAGVALLDSTMEEKSPICPFLSHLCRGVVSVDLVILTRTRAPLPITS